MSLIIKVVQGKYLNENAVSNVVQYIYRGAMILPEQERLIGSIGFPEDSDPDVVIQRMMATKRIYGLEDGVQCKHIVVSFGGKPCLSRKKLKKIMVQISGFWKQRYQLYWGVHHNREEKNENFHLHILLNSVNMKTGRKINITNKLWRKFVKSTTRIWGNAMRESGISTGG